MPKKVNILLVEDEAIIALLLKRNLERAGYNVYKPLATGEAAVEAVKTNDVDVALMDIRLAGEIDGVEAAEKIVSLCNTPIIFMTGYVDNDVRERAQALNPVAYLVKPVTPNDITPVIAGLFGEGEKEI